MTTGEQYPFKLSDVRPLQFVELDGHWFNRDMIVYFKRKDDINGLDSHRTTIMLASRTMEGLSMLSIVVNLPEQAVADRLNGTSFGG